MTAVTREQQALDLASKGFYVFPAAAKDRPLIKRWQDAATLDADLIRKWWAAWPSALPCIVPGLSGHTVIDIDVHEDRPSGFDSALTAGAPVTAEFSNISMSGNGLHLWYLGTNRTGQKVNGMEAIDSRSIGGYVVAHDTYELPEASLVTEPLPEKYRLATTAASSPTGTTVQRWQSAMIDGAAREEVQIAARNVTTTGISHQAMLDATNELVRLATTTGDLDQIELARGRYALGYDVKYAAAWDSALAGSVDHFGLPQTVKGARLQFGLPAEIAPAPGPDLERNSAVVSEGEPMFVDLDGLDSFDPPRASLVQRTDGPHLLYRGAVNGLVGDPEQGKSLVAVAMALEAARADLATVWLDLDHNGPVAFRSRLIALGWDKADGFDKFRFAQPEDRDGVKDVIKWAVEQARLGLVGLVVIDSLGELLPMFGASSDSSDDYTRVNREVTVPAALAGAAVLTIDHLAKSSESRAYGSTGTMAKKRAIDGAYYRVTAIKAFAPGQGGKALLKVLKDRHGSVRNSTVDGSGKEPEAAIWELEANGKWSFTKPGIRTNPVLLDVTRLALATPTFTSQNQVRKAFGWGAERTRKAWEEWTR